MSASDSKTVELESKPSESKIPEQQSSTEPSDPKMESESEGGRKSQEDSYQSPKLPDDGVDGRRDEDQEEEEEEEGECGFCLFMKGGGCRESFIAWEHCIEDAEKKEEDIVEKCFQVTAALKKCMEAHPDYYEPILRAEKVAEEEAMKELEKEAASNDSNQNTGSNESEKNVSSRNSEDHKA